MNTNNAHTQSILKHSGMRSRLTRLSSSIAARAETWLARVPKELQCQGAPDPHAGPYSPCAQYHQHSSRWTS